MNADEEKELRDELREIRTFIALEEIGELIRQGEAEYRAYRDREEAQAFIDAAEAQQWIDEHEDEEQRYNHNHDSKGRFARSNSGLTSGGKSATIDSRGDRMTISSSVESPIEQYHTGKGNPNAILLRGSELNDRQKRILDKLPEYDSRIIVPRDDVNMNDLSALTAYTGDEFAMFTKNNERLIIRGNTVRVNISPEDAAVMNKQGYRWSGHTHPGIDMNVLIPSEGDKLVLREFTNQETSVIYNSKGSYFVFGKE